MTREESWGEERAGVVEISTGKMWDGMDASPWKVPSFLALLLMQTGGIGPETTRSPERI